MTMERILVIAAHPDDDILGCGGMMAKFSKKGSKIRVLFIGEGSTCRFNGFDINSDSAKKDIEKRNKCGKSALNVLNIDNYHFYNLSCGRFDQIPLIEIGKIIEKEIEDFKPDTVFTHSINDVHNDHIRTFQATLQATRPGVQNFVSRIYSFEILSSSEWRFIETFVPNFFLNLKMEEVELKIEAFEQYITEKKDYPFPRSREGILTCASYRGMQAGTSYAEAFQLIREIIL